MALSWSSKKRLSYLLIVFLFIIAVSSLIGIFIFYKFYKGTCFDKKQNQKETGIDCGGPCGPCAYGLKDPVIIWTRFLKQTDDPDSHKYSIAALINNPNLNWGSEEIAYSFKLFDENNLLLAEREGKTFLNPKQEFIIFENSINTGEKESKKAFASIYPINNWKYLQKSPPEFTVTKKTFDKNSGILEIELKNESSYDVSNIFVSADLADKDGNIFAASATKIDRISAFSKEKAFFTWLVKFSEEPSQIEVIPRINLMENN